MQGPAARQRTVARPVRCSGVGLHTGQPVELCVGPAAADSGIAFRRLDLDGRAARVPACWRGVVETRLCTILENGSGARVGTVEHLMAAFAGCGIDNALVDLDGPEVPAMDGSAAPFVALLDRAGYREQPAPRRAIRVLREIAVGDAAGRARLVPADAFAVDVAIAFESPAIARQRCVVPVVEPLFRREIAPARTFGLMEEVARLRAMGLARGGSLDNAVVVDGARVLNAGGLRFANEFARHKALDAIGDLALAGAPILGRFEGERSGHRLNNLLLHALFADAAAWRWETLPAEPVALATA